jgi:hypothetical protein
VGARGGIPFRLRCPVVIAVRASAALAPGAAPRRRDPGWGGAGAGASPRARVALTLDVRADLQPGDSLRLPAAA